ncbi:MAG: mechanosensitive ion channel family protein [Firmicutes bacterium]|nr:mechanosensitive ion channel family protein [Bacillota bacterium]
MNTPKRNKESEKSTQKTNPCNKKQSNNLLNVVFDLNEVDEKMSKNEIEYHCRQRQRKIRRIIRFSIFTAIIVAVYVFAFTVNSLASYPYPAIANWVRINLLFWDNASASPAILTLVYISLTIITVQILEFIIHIFVRAKSKQGRTMVALLAHAIKYIAVVILLIILADIWNIDPAILAAILAAFGIAIGFGAQGLIGDLITGLFLIFEKSLQVGDILNFNGFRGEVEDIGFRTTKIRSVTGEVKIINNSQLKVFINMTMHRSIASCDINIDYGANLKFVEEVIVAHLPVIADKYPVISEGPIYKGVQEFNDKGVMLKIIAKCFETERLQLQRDLNREFKILFDEHGIKIAVPKMELVGSEVKTMDGGNK